MSKWTVFVNGIYQPSVLAIRKFEPYRIELRFDFDLKPGDWVKAMGGFDGDEWREYPPITVKSVTRQIELK